MMEIGSAASPPCPVAEDPHTRREEGVEEGMELFRASKGALRRIDSTMLTVCAERGEIMRRNGRIPTPPPIELVDYPDLFERAWGWDSLLPHDLVTPLPLYKIYLQHYYIRNHQREANAAGADDLGLDGDDHGNGLLAALADKCIKMEGTLKHMWSFRVESFTIDDDEKEVTLVSDNITNHARQMAQVRGSEFPAAAIALKCIIKEAELMCQCIVSRDSVVSFAVSNAVRRCALIFMTCKDYVPAAAAMMGIMKEAVLAIGLLRGDQNKNNEKIACADRVRHRTMLIMLEMCDECSAVQEATVADITGNLNSNQSDNKLADNGNHEERGNVSESKNSKEKLAGNDMDGSSRTGEKQNPNENLGRNSLEKGKVEPEKARAGKQGDPVGINNEGYSSTSKHKKVDISKTDEKNSKKQLARNVIGASNRTDENQNPNENLGRNSLEKGKVKPNTKAHTEKQVDLVGSSYEGYSYTSKKLKDVLKEPSSPLYGKAVGHKKWISGCFSLENQGNANGTAS